MGIKGLVAGNKEVSIRDAPVGLSTLSILHLVAITGQIEGKKCTNP